MKHQRLIGRSSFTCISKNYLLFLFLSLFLCTSLLGQNCGSYSEILVTNTNDSGNGSLRWAIDQANNDSSPSRIRFNILTSNKTIKPVSGGFNVQGNCTIIDASTQSDICIDGSLLTETFDTGFRFTGVSDCLLKGVKITNFPNDGVHAVNCFNINIENCEFQANGRINLGEGISVDGCNSVYIYQNYSGENTIGVGNSDEGIDVRNSNDVFIQSNRVKGNTEIGIVIYNCNNVLIGGDSLNKNHVSGNNFDGIQIELSSTIEVTYNDIGRDLDGQLIGNMDEGIECISSNDVIIHSNYVFGSSDAGILAKGMSSDIEIGTSSVVNQNIIENNKDGIRINESSQNIILGINSVFCNNSDGIEIASDSNTGISSPTISSATTTSISGTSSTNAFIDLYQHDNTACSNLPCQGKTYIGSTQANNSGSWTYTGSIQQGSTITAIATKNNNSSEYADCVSVEQGANCDTPPTIVQTLDKGHTYLKLQFEHVDDAQSYHLRWRKQGTSSWQYEMDLQEFAYVESSHHYPHYPSCYCSSTCIGLPAFSFPTIVDIRGIEPCTTYEFQIASVCLNGQTSSYSTYYENTEECNNSYFNSDNYCVGRFSDYARISQFKIGGIGYDYDNDHNPCEYCNGCQSPYEGYQFFSNREIVLTKGNSVGRNGNDDNGEACDSSNSPFELCIDGDGSDLEDWYFNIWIDYNGDGDFLDFNENVYNEFFGFDIYNFCQNLTECEYFTIPSNITVSNSRVRISLSQGSDITPNEAFNYGHVWDFPVRFEENVTIPSCDLTNDEILCLDWVEDILLQSINGGCSGTLRTGIYQGGDVYVFTTQCNDGGFSTGCETIYLCDGTILEESCGFPGPVLSQNHQQIINSTTNLETIWTENSEYPSCGGQTDEKIFFISNSINSEFLNIWSMDLSGNRVALFTDNFHRTNLIVDEANKKLFYVKSSTTLSLATIEEHYIYKSNFDGSNEEMVFWVNPNFGSMIVDLTVSEDGNKLGIVFREWENIINNRDGDIYLLNLETNSLDNITNDSDYPEHNLSFTPEGNKIIYTRNSEPWFGWPINLYEVDLNTNEKTILIDSTGFNNGISSGGWPCDCIIRSPRVSADGSKIMFSRGNFGGIWELNENNDTASLFQQNTTEYSDVRHVVFGNTNQDILFVNESISLNWIDQDGTILQEYFPTINTKFVDVYYYANDSSPCDISLSNTATAATCGNSNGSIFALVNGGTAPFQYNIGNGNQNTSTFNNLASGTYTITVTDSEDCSATDTANIFNDGVAPPEAYFTYTNNGLTVSFNTIIAPDPNSYSWSFGDGNISSASDPTHTYNTSGTYNVCLTLSNTCGSDTYCEDISMIGDLPDCPATAEEILCLGWLNSEITQLQEIDCNLDFVNVGLYSWGQNTLIGIGSSGFGGSYSDYYDCEGNLVASCSSGFIGNDCDPITEEFELIEGLWSCNDVIPSCESPWEITGCTGFSAFSTHSIVLNRRDGFFAADIAGEELSSNDWVGIFYTDENGIEHCAGAKQYPAEEDIIVFDVCVNDSATPQKDGFELGEAFVFRVWQNGVENADVKAEYYPEGVSILNTNIVPSAEELFNLSNKVSYLKSIKRKVVIGDADCEDPIDITCELLPNMTNEVDASEVNFYCGSDNYVNGSEVYFSFDNDVVQDVKIKIDNMVEDLELYILNEDCNEDNCVALSENQETEKEIVLLTNLEIGTYHIAVDGYIGATSTFDIDIECGDFGGGSGGSNDDPIDPDDPSDPPIAECPKSISCNSSATCTTVGLSNNIYSYGCSPNRFNGGAEKIFTFVSPEDKWVYISMTPEDGVNLDLFALSGELPQSDCYKSSTSFDDETEGFWMWAIGNKEYYIVVDGYDEDAGSFTLNVGTCQDPSDGGGNGGGGGDNPPFALDCDDIPELTCGVPLQGTNANGSDVYSSWGDCDGRNNNGREVFYRFDNPVAQQVLIELTNMTENLNVYILDECNPFTCIGDGGTKGRERFDNEDEAVIHPLLAAGEYIIVVDGVENASSNFTLSIDCEDTSFECLQIDLLVNGSNKSNYISSNLLPADRDVASILNPFDDIIQVVSNDRNIAWTPGDPPVLGEWKDLDAFRVLLREEITQDTFIEICGSPVDTAAIKELQGLADQPLPNFIGYPFSYDQPALGIFPDDTGITKLIWQTPDETLFQNPLSTDNAFDLSAGNGYVVMSSEERDLSYRNLDYYNNGCTHFPMQWFGSLQISTVRLGKGFIHALSLKEGDEIAFTTEKGRIVASHIVGNDPFTVVLQGDELDSDTVEGFGIDEIMYFKTWKASTNTEMTYRPVFSNELTNFKVGVHYNIVDVDFINSNTRIDNTSFKVFPNPFSNNIQIVGQFEESDQVQILDVNGQILKQIPTTTGKLLEINIDNSLSAGIYIVKIVKEDSIFIEKIIKQN